MLCSTLQFWYSVQLLIKYPTQTDVDFVALEMSFDISHYYALPA